MDVGIGFALQPDHAYMELCGGLLREEVDYFEVAPETTWKAGRPGSSFEPNAFHAEFLELGHETGLPFVAHGVGISMGSSPRDPRRDQRWLLRLKADQLQFRFQWYTDHLGTTVVEGNEVALPLPLPHTEAASQATRAGLALMHSAVPIVGLENSAFYFHAGDPLEEASWIARVLEHSSARLLLDLHNVHTMATNAGFDPRAYLDRLPLERVIEMHVSGGSNSDSRWLRSGRVLRLDSHDGPVPEAVWDLCAYSRPRCPNLRGITLERIEGTVRQDDVPLLREELRRANRLAQSAHGI